MSNFGYKKESFSDRPEDPNNVPAQQPQQEQMGFFTRTAIHVIGAVVGALTIVIGLFNCISIKGVCILNGFYMMVLGFGLIIMEAPICCSFWKITDTIGSWSMSLSPLIKALMYLLLPLVTFVCFSPSQIVACFLVMGVGALYGIVFIGKKGDGIKVARQQHVAGDEPVGVSMSEVQPQDPPAYSTDRYP